MPAALPARSAGLGLRRALLDPLIEAPTGAFDFLECAPDNWIGVGGPLADKLAGLSARHPLSCHGLSLSLGGPDPLDRVFLQQTRDFLDRHQVALYSEHLSYCSAGGHLYDLLPIPFTDDAVTHVAARIRQVQDADEQRAKPQERAERDDDHQEVRQPEALAQREVAPAHQSPPPCSTLWMSSFEAFARSAYWKA